MTYADRPVRLAKCERCGAIVFAARVDGFDVVVDPASLDLGAYRDALIGRRATYRMKRSTSGAPTVLQTDTPSWRSDAERLGAHACGVGTRPLDEVVQGPPRAPATHGSEPAGSHRPTAPAGAQGKSSAAMPATRPRSDYLARRCCYCDEIIGTGFRWGMQLGDKWIWVACERCSQ